MYNRYIRDDKGVYTRIPQDEQARPGSGHSRREETRKQEASPPRHRQESSGKNYGSTSQKHTEQTAQQWGAFDAAQQETPPHESKRTASGSASDGLTGILRHFLDRFHMDHVDTGDLLLLGLLFFLFREDADEELLMALGLLLIL